MSSPCHQFRLAALYKFVHVKDTTDTQSWLETISKEHRIQGTLILAEEGINGTIAGKPDDIIACISAIRKDSRFSDIDVKYSDSDSHPFVRMNVKVKAEIVTLGVDDGTVDPNALVGEYVDPAGWNEVILDPEVTVIDCRNSYEYDIGTFERAINPETKTFREFPEWVDRTLRPDVHKKVAMFCTGGIRCEKASSFMLARGYEKVYHLKGGVLKYLEEFGVGRQQALPPAASASVCPGSVEGQAPAPTPAGGPADGDAASTVYVRKPDAEDGGINVEKSSTWKGQCFVFDDRVSVGHGLQPGDYRACRGCRYPCSPEDRQLPPNRYSDGVYCPHCVDTLTPEQKAANAERHHQMMLAEKRGNIHLGRTT